MDRKEFIGSSDIAAAIGMSRWKTPLALWAEKTGNAEEQDLSDNEAVEWGSKLEALIAKKFEEKTGLKVRRAPQAYVHRNYPQFRCQVDRLIENTDMLLECKTCNAWKAKEWEGEEIPQEYIIQVIWQLGITGRSTGYIAVLIGGQKFKYKKIEFDADMYNDMVKRALDFWQCVVNGTPPMALGDDNYNIVELYPEHSEAIEAADDLNATIAYLQETKMHIGEMLKEKDKVEATIKQAIGKNLGIKTPEYIVTWKGQVTRRVDSDKLKADNLYEKYLKESKTRILRIRKEKGNGKAKSDSKAS